MTNMNSGACRHADLPDPVILATHFYPIGEMHFADLGVHLALHNCASCKSTVALPLAGHVSDDAPASATSTDQVRGW